MTSGQLYIPIATVGQCPLHVRAECIQKVLRVSTGIWVRKDGFGVLVDIWNQNELASGKRKPWLSLMR